tara:strand:- start:690 stop:896 length:207 start_codon:yes stop_codon:yes gene_type:complete
MLEKAILDICNENPEIRDLKIKNIEHAISQAEEMIRESKMSQNELIFLKKKIADSMQDLEILYLMKNK